MIKAEIKNNLAGFKYFFDIILYVRFSNKHKADIIYTKMIWDFELELVQKTIPTEINKLKYISKSGKLVDIK